MRHIVQRYRTVFMQALLAGLVCAGCAHRPLIISDLPASNKTSLQDHGPDTAVTSPTVTARTKQAEVVQLATPIETPTPQPVSPVAKAPAVYRLGGRMLSDARIVHAAFYKKIGPPGSTLLTLTDGAHRTLHVWFEGRGVDCGATGPFETRWRSGLGQYQFRIVAWRQQEDWKRTLRRGSKDEAELLRFLHDWWSTHVPGEDTFQDWWSTHVPGESALQGRSEIATSNIVGFTIIGLEQPKCVNPGQFSLVELALSLSLSRQAEEIWEEKLMTMGNTRAAREAAVNAVRALPFVEDAGVNPASQDFWRVDTSGFESGISGHCHFDAWRSVNPPWCRLLEPKDD